MANKLHVKTGDQVIVTTGNAKGTIGKVLEVSPKEGKVIVEGFNMITKHLKPTQMNQSGNIVRAEAPIYACKVQLVCPKCGKPTRTGSVVEDGKKLRVCKKCGKSFE